jgi:hypothetical protein
MTGHSRIRILVLLLAPVLHAADVKTDFDPAADFHRYKTFSFIGGQELTKTGLLSNPATRERIKNFIAGAMGLHGLAEVPKDEKYDLAVRYWVARQHKSEEYVVPGDDFMFAGYPPYWTGYWGWSYEEYVVHNYVQGTLVIDLIDPATKELVWRTFLRQKIEDRVKAYDEAKKNLEKSFARFPPSDPEKEKMRRQRQKLARKYGNSDIGEMIQGTPQPSIRMAWAAPANLDRS